MNAEEIKALDAAYVAPTYARTPLVLERAEGVRVYDADGRAYLDFVAGIAVNALGHNHPEVTAAIVAQLGRLDHVSNLYLTAPQARVARTLVEHSFADKVYFCNSGAESVEAAIKFARKWANAAHGEGRSEFVAFSGAFHGRTMGALALTPRPHYQDPFRPLMPGARYATFNDLASAETLVSEATCAVIVEPLQGEGGVYPASPAFLQGLRELCDRRGALLIFDEVQCGLGRTGYLWAHEAYGVAPDLMTLAKPLGGGLPMGAVLMNKRVADVLAPGDHASTFAGGPVVCAAAEVVLGKVTDPAFLAGVRAVGEYLGERLHDMQEDCEAITAVRGRGLIWGLEARADVGPVLAACQEGGLLACKAGPNVLRLIPPLVVSREDVDQAVEILQEAFRAIE